MLQDKLTGLPGVFPPLFMRFMDPIWYSMLKMVCTNWRKLFIFYKSNTLLPQIGLPVTPLHLHIIRMSHRNNVIICLKPLNETYLYLSGGTFRFFCSRGSFHRNDTIDGRVYHKGRDHPAFQIKIRGSSVILCKVKEYDS